MIHADQPGEDAAVTLEDLFGHDAEDSSSPPRVDWRPGHETVVWLDPRTDTGPVLMEFEPVTGARRALLDDERMTAMWADREGSPPVLAQPTWSPSGTSMIIASEDELLLIDLTEGAVSVLATGDGVEEHTSFSPDGRRLAWVRDNDLWIYDLENGRESRLTSDGSETVFNGVFDWVYEEELAGRDGRAYEWSHDGSRLVWLRLDDERIPIHHLVDLMETHSKVTRQRYPKPGDPAPTPTLHVIRLDDDSNATEPKRVTFSDPLPYVPRFGFSPDGDLWYQVLDRAQKRLRLMRVDLDTDSTSILLDERDPFWITPVDGLRFLTDGSFLWLSRRGGFEHLYRIIPDGRAVDLSPGEWDITELVGVDADERFAWYQAARPRVVERHLFRVDVTSGATTALTAGGGSHSATVSPARAKLLVSRSGLDAPTRLRVVDSGGSGVADVPVGDPSPRFPGVGHRFVEIPADDETVLQAMLMLPPDFDETRRHPVVIYTYGGPNAQVVLDTRPRASGRFNHWLATRGFVVFALDNRGSSNRGRAFEGAVDRALGSSQLPDQLAGVGWLVDQPWVDPDRIGIWGWSYGGYMTTYALTHAPGTFAAGAAVAPVTDWRLYDSIYTERYMGSPEENPEGYAMGSVLGSVANLVDPLLVIHGTGDDNVHVQHTLQLADRAWRAGVRFDLMLFPNLAHGIRAPGSHLQVFGAIADFFERHLVEQSDGD
jgi:dipeptidyl-peptidase-4